MSSIKKWTAPLLTALMTLTLSGCLYPDEQRGGNDVSAREAVLSVQDAVDRYKKKTGVLPIRSADAKVPKYEKYELDLGKMQRTGYIGSIPPMAFEKGGSYTFLVINEETKPQVKLMNIALSQVVSGVQKRVNEYRRSHDGGNPAGEQAYPGFFHIDYGKLGGSEPEVKSDFSRQALSLLIDGDGVVYIDYAIDVAEAIRKSGRPTEEGEDLRARLVDASYYVPVKAPIYHWEKEAPVPVTALKTG